MNDTRKERRAALSLNVRFKSATVDDFIEHNAGDISRGGIFIKSSKPMRVGTLLKFEIQLQDESRLIHGVGRVVWRREEDAPGDLPPGMGIKFIKIDAQSRALVDQIVERRPSAANAFDAGVSAQAPASVTEAPLFPETTPPELLPKPEESTQMRHAREFLASAFSATQGDAAKETSTRAARARAEAQEAERAASRPDRPRSKRPRYSTIQFGSLAPPTEPSLGTPTDPVRDEAPTRPTTAVADGRAVRLSEEPTPIAVVSNSPDGNVILRANRTDPVGSPKFGSLTPPRTPQGLFGEDDSSDDEAADTLRPGTGAPSSKPAPSVAAVPAESARSKTDPGALVLTSRRSSRPPAGAFGPSLPEKESAAAAGSAHEAAQSMPGRANAAAKLRGALAEEDSRSSAPTGGVPRVISFAAVAVLLAVAAWFLFLRTPEPAYEPETPAPAPTGASPSDERSLEVGPPPSTLPDEAAPVEATELVTLTVQSTPPGAEVSREASLLGTTPLTVSLAQGENINLRIRLAGHREVEERLSLGDEDSELTVSLEALPYHIRVETIPPGALVSTQGVRPVVAPGLLVLPAPPRGDIALTAMMAGHARQRVVIAEGSFRATDEAMEVTATIDLPRLSDTRRRAAPRPTTGEAPSASAESPQDDPGAAPPSPTEATPGTPSQPAIRETSPTPAETAPAETAPQTPTRVEPPTATPTPTPAPTATSPATPTRVPSPAPTPPSAGAAPTMAADPLPENAL